jgi:predicted ester cyclase
VGEKRNEARYAGGTMSELTDFRDRFYDEAINRGDVEAGASMLAPDVENQFPGTPPGTDSKGVEGFRKFVSPFFKGFPDARITVLNTVESGDTIVTEGVYRGTHTGALDGPEGSIPPTGRQIELPFASTFKLRAGKAVVQHLYFDRLTFMAQLGLAGQPTE